MTQDTIHQNPQSNFYKTMFNHPNSLNLPSASHPRRGLGPRRSIRLESWFPPGLCVISISKLLTWLKFSTSPGESSRNTCYLCPFLLSTPKFTSLLGQSVSGKFGGNKTGEGGFMMLEINTSPYDVSASQTAFGAKESIPAAWGALS